MLKNQKSKIVALDLDNTLNFLSLEYISYAEYHLGIHMTPENNDRHFQHYDLAKYFPEDFTSEEIQAVTNDIFSDYNFWIGMQPHPNSAELVYSINENSKYDLRIVTYPWHFLQGSIDGKMDWIKRHFPYIKSDQVIFQHDKWNGPYDIVIDDNVEILNNCFDKGMHILRYFHFYNIKAKCHHSFRELTQIKDYLENTYE